MTKAIRIKMMDRQELFDGSRNFITVVTIIRVFDLPSDAIVKLWFETEGEKIYCEMNDAGTRFLLPDGYLTMKFFANATRVPSRTTRPMYKPPPMSPLELEKEENRIITSIKNRWESRVFHIAGDKLTGTCVLIDDRRALTAAHLGFKLNQSYTIKGAENREFSVECVVICTDYAILQSDDFPLLELPMAHLQPGSKYYMMGFPNDVDLSNPTIKKGAIKGIGDCFHPDGTPGWKQGYSGAPVFNASGIFGILTGSSANTTGLFGKNIFGNSGCLDCSAGQKYARIIEVAYIVNSHRKGPAPNYALF